MHRTQRIESIRNRLLWRIHRRYDTTTAEVRLDRLHLSFTRVADPDRVLDRVAQEADLRERLTGQREADEQLHLPYWAELWDSAMGIGRFLEGWGLGGRWSGFRVAGCGFGDQDIPVASSLNPEPQTLSPSSSLNPQPRTPNPPSVLDLGCGMGLCGTIAAALGARVLMADIEPAALLFARLNSLPWSSRAKARRLDWRVDRLNERFDLILGADILYERSQWPFLEPFWRRHLAPGGGILLGEPGRQTGDLFIDWITARGWRLDRFEQKVDTRQQPIRILRLTPQPTE